MIIPEKLLGQCDTLFLDRDGVVNVWLPGDYVKTWEEFRFNEGFTEFICRYSACFRYIIVVTNQRGVGKGLMTFEQLEEIHARMLETIAGSGGRIDHIYVCTSVSESDPMRKPNPGMALQAMRDYPDIAMERSLMIGDQPSDRIFARNCGMHFLFWEN
ncbi:MAG: HAD-IIIA family hydrolase [Bacteroidaceae bacterium]|nr:HAD-IIIA family hydrolase [Bacteroidaceae bacterium]